MTHTSYYVADARLSEATYRVACGGELDLAARSELSQALARATSSGAENLELDLTKVTFIDSTAIKVIARVGGEIRARGGRVEATFGNQNVLRIFEITGLERLFELTLMLPPEPPVEELA